MLTVVEVVVVVMVVAERMAVVMMVERMVELTSSPRTSLSAGG